MNGKFTPIKTVSSCFYTLSLLLDFLLSFVFGIFQITFILILFLFNYIASDDSVNQYINSKN